MSVKRDDVDAGRVDFSDVVDLDQPRLDPIHPGQILVADFLEPLGLSVYALARATGVSRSRLNDIARGKRAVTAETALRLARYFGTSPDLWMGLQAHYELERAQHMLGDRVVAEVRPRAA